MAAKHTIHGGRNFLTKRQFVKTEAACRAAGRFGQGPALDTLPIFSLPLGDAGAGVVSTLPSFAAGSPTATFTRATTAWTKLSNGLWASVASGSPRSCYLGLDTTVGGYGGYLAEGARTNSCLWSRDLTNAAWTKGATMTAALTATGIDGSANSATTLTGGAVAATNIVTQAITLGSTGDTFSCWIKRLVGSGVISITLDNISYTDITSQINSSTYTLVQVQQTLANPTVGIKIATNADSIAVDMCQMEAGTFASTPIPITTVAVTRNVDILTYALTSNLSNTLGSLFFETVLPNSATATASYLIASSGANAPILYSTTNSAAYFDGTNNPTLSGVSFSGGGLKKCGAAWSGTTVNYAINGIAASSNPSPFDGSWNMTDIEIGNGASGLPAFGMMRNVRIYPSALSAAQLQAMTAP